MKKIIKIEPSAVGKILMRKRVAAYCRVSSGKEEQLESLEAQKTHYEEYISSNPEWEYAQENNSLINETEKLKKEKEQIINGANDQKHRTAALEELIRFTVKQEMLSEFDVESFENFVDHATVVSRTTVTFHLKCGLNLSEVIQK